MGGGREGRWIQENVRNVLACCSRSRVVSDTNKHKPMSTTLIDFFSFARFVCVCHSKRAFWETKACTSVMSRDAVCGGWGGARGKGKQKMPPSLFYEDDFGIFMKVNCDDSSVLVRWATVKSDILFLFFFFEIFFPPFLFMTAGLILMDLFDVACLPFLPILDTCLKKREEEIWMRCGGWKRERRDRIMTWQMKKAEVTSKICLGNYGTNYVHW